MGFCYFGKGKPMHKRNIINLVSIIIGLTILLPVSQIQAQKQSGAVSNSTNRFIDLETVKQATSKKSTTNTSPKVKPNRFSDEVRFLLRPKYEVDIATQTAGIVERIEFNVGQRFKKGDLLVKLGCGAQFARLQAQRAKVKESNLNYKSNQQLLAGNAVSRYDVDIAKAKLDQERANLSEQSILTNFCKIKAPFSGGVATVYIDKHAFIAENTELMKLIDDSELVMSLNIPSKWATKIKNGTFFSVDVDEVKKRYKAKIVGVSPAIDPISKTIELRAVLVNKTKELKPGMSGTAILDFSTKKVQK